MAPVLTNEIKALILLNRALKKTGYKVRIFGFSEYKGTVYFGEIPEEKIPYLKIFDLTPTHKALEQMYHIIKKDNNTHKILILITDGQPVSDLDKGFIKLPNGISVRKAWYYTNAWINELEKICKVYTLFITSDRLITEQLKWMFSKNFYIVDQQDLENDLVKFVRNIIIKDLKRR